MVALLLVLVVMEIQGRRGGGGGRSSSRGGGGRSRSISRIFSRRSSGGGGGMFGRRGGGSSRGGSSFKKRLVKGAALGAGAYVGYKATKALGKFAARGLTGMTGLGDYRFEDWDSWRQQDGMLCRTDADCWLDPQLECADYEFDFSISRAWFGGDWMSVRGQCQCRSGLWFDDNDLSCMASSYWASAAGILIIIFLFIPCGCCCLCGCCYYVYNTL